MSDTHDWEQADKGMREELDRMNRTTNILMAISAERRNQQKKWGEQNHPLGFGQVGSQSSANFARYLCEARFEKGTGTWADILGEEYFEARAESDLPAARKELIQVAAVCVAIIDWIDRGAPNAE